MAKKIESDKFFDADKKALGNDKEEIIKMDNDNGDKDFKILTTTAGILVVSGCLYSLSPILFKYTCLLSIVCFTTNFLLKMIIDEKLLNKISNNKTLFNCISLVVYLILGLLLSSLFNIYYVLLFITFIALTVILRIINSLKEQNKKVEEDKENEFFLNYPEVKEKYKSTLDILDQKGSKFISFRTDANTILRIAIDLYFEKKKRIESKKNISAIKKEIEEDLSKAATKSDAIPVLKNRLEVISKREIADNQVISEAEEEIKNSIYNLLVIKSDVELGTSDSANNIKEAIKAMQNKSKHLAFLDEHSLSASATNGNELLDESVQK